MLAATSVCDLEGKAMESPIYNKEGLNLQLNLLRAGLDGLIWNCHRPKHIHDAFIRDTADEFQHFLRHCCRLEGANLQRKGAFPQYHETAVSLGSHVVDSGSY